MVVYKLCFTSPLHLCAGFGGYEKTFLYLHSDTLFSAILANWSHLYDETIESIIKNEPFQVSSAFPFFGSRYYFPRPQKPLLEEKIDYKPFKKLRKAQFIEKALFEKILHHQTVSYKDIHFSRSQQLISLQPDVVDCFEERELSRNMVDRVHGNTEIFYFAELVFHANAGLFFMVHFKDLSFKPKLEAVLRFLGDEGIGGDRTLGKGLFNLEIVEDFNLNYPEQGTAMVNLSLYHPKEEEIAGQLLTGAAYDLVTRKGWITTPGYSHLRKKSLIMFREGSVFPNLKRDGYGDIPIVAPRRSGLLDFDVYRYGKGFFVGCLFGESHE